jgi:uncharacterized protein (TIGR02145 family)
MRFLYAIIFLVTIRLVLSGVFSLFEASPGPSLFTAQGMLKDSEGNEYRTVTLNGIEWLAENLSTSKFRDGRELFHATNKAEWDSAQKNGIAAWMSFKFDRQNEEKYGKLYNRQAVLDSIGLAPEGWFLASDNDFHNLLKSVSVGYVIIDGDEEEEIDGKNDAELLRSEKEKWLGCTNDFFPDDYGTNESGFSALPAGYYWNNNWSDAFTRGKLQSMWWCRNPDQSFVIGEHESVNISKLPKDKEDFGLYVRLVKAKP